MSDVTDLNTLMDGQRVLLKPLPGNPLHKAPVMATFSSGYFYCDSTDPMDGPDYYWRDVLVYNEIAMPDEAKEAGL